MIETKIIVYKDDDDSVKDKTCIIIDKDEFGVKIQLYNDKTNENIGVPFILPTHRVLKIKDKKGDNENDK